MPSSPTLLQTLLLPAAGIAVGPLPFPGLSVEVPDEVTLEIVGDGVRYRFTAPGFEDEERAQQQLDERLRSGGAAPGWAVVEELRFYIARESADATTARVGSITRAGEDGPVTIVERVGLPAISESEQFAREATTLTGLAGLWLKSAVGPVDAVVHTALSSEELNVILWLPAGRVPVGMEDGLVVTQRLSGVERARLAFGAVAATTGEDAEGLARVLGDDPGVHEPRVRSVDGETAEVLGLLRPARGDAQLLRCRVIPADDGRGFAACTVAPEWDEEDEPRRVIAAITESVSRLREPDEDLPAPATALAEVLADVGHFRHRTDSDGRRVADG